MIRDHHFHWKLTMLATFLVALAGSPSTKPQSTQGRGRRNLDRPTGSGKAGERKTKNRYLDWEKPQLVDGGFVVHGTDHGRSFVNVLADPMAFKGIDGGTRRIYRALREVGLGSAKAKHLVKSYAAIVPQMELFDQTTTSTVLGSVRVLPDGSFNTLAQWQKAGLVMEPKGFKPDILDRPSDQKIRLRMGDGRDVWLPATIRNAFPEGDVTIHEGKFRIKSPNTPFAPAAMSAILCKEAIENGSEPARLVFGTKERKKRNPVVVLTAFHMRPDADPLLQLTTGDLYANLVAFEIDLDSVQLWSIQTACLPLYAYVHLCGAGHGMAASARSTAIELGLEAKLAKWLGNCELQVDFPLFRSIKRNY